MAYSNYDLDEEEKQLDPNAPQEATTGPESGIVAGQDTADSPNQSNSPASATSAGQKSGSNFVGINEYLSANKPQTAKLAENVAGYVNDQGQNARNELDANYEGGSVNKYNNEVDQNTVNLNQALVDKVAAPITTPVDNTKKISTLNAPAPIKLTDTTPAPVVVGGGAAEVDNDAAQKAEFQKMRDAQYNGPSSFEGTQYYQPAAQAVETASKTAEDTKTEQGRTNLINAIQKLAQRHTTQGATTLDQALIQADTSAKETLGNAYQAQQDLPAILEAAKEAGLSKAQGAAATTEGTRKAIQDKFTGDSGVIAQMEKELTNRVSQVTGTPEKQAKVILDAINKGANLSDEQLKILGSTRDQYNKLVNDINLYKKTWKSTEYNDLSPYATLLNASANINAQNLATPDDYARYAALNDLMGAGGSLLTNPSLASTANMDGLDFKFNDLQKRVTDSIATAKKADADRAAAAAAAEAARKKQREEEQATLIGAGTAFQFGDPILGGLVGMFCFVENTPILMKDGSYKMVQEIDLGDQVAVGDMVTGRGEVLCTQIVEYKGRITSSQHAVFNGMTWVRAIDLYGAKTHDLKSPIKVYPLVTEQHILISDNGVVYADLVEVDKAGLSDTDKLIELNRSQIELAKAVEKEIQWTALNTEQNSIAS